MKTLPIIDFTSEDSPERIHQALGEFGFFYLVNHGVDSGLQENLIKTARDFFALPADIKMKIEMANGGLAWRGYFPVGGELTSGIPDQKEGLYFGEELTSSDSRVQQRLPLHGPNLWPNQELKTQVLSYMESLRKLGKALMRLIAEGLGLDNNYFDKRFTENPTQLFRIFNYPRQVDKDNDDWGVREHTDMGFLTILRQDSQPGLQVKTLVNEWIEAPPLADSFVINIGDMLEYWTHGIYRATPHRVRNQGNRDRISLPFFFDPGWTTSLQPIDSHLLRSDDLNGSEVHPRWDGLELHKLPQELQYGQFVWKKVSSVFPHLAKLGKAISP